MITTEIFHYGTSKYFNEIQAGVDAGKNAKERLKIFVDRAIAIIGEHSDFFKIYIEFLAKEAERVEAKEMITSFYDQYITTLAYSPDGTLLVVGDTQGFIRIWNLKTRQLQLELNTFTDPVTHVVFNPDGNLVASNLGGSTNFYALSPDKLINLVRSRIIRPMTPEECLTYLRLETCPPWP